MNNPILTFSLKYVKNLSFNVSTGDDHHQDQGGTTWAAKLPLSVASRVNCLLLLMEAMKRREKILSLSLGDQLCCIASYGNKQPLSIDGAVIETKDVIHWLMLGQTDF